MDRSSRSSRGSSRPTPNEREDEEEAEVEEGRARRVDSNWRRLAAGGCTLEAGEVAERVAHAAYASAGSLERAQHAAVCAYQALSECICEHLVQRANRTYEEFQARGVKQVAYLSLEFLIGRCLSNAVHNLESGSVCGEALGSLGYALEDLAEEEYEAGLGNGGLGRLAACYMDSLASLNYPAWGYGLRYKYGIFEQRIVNGRQVEGPDHWLTRGYPWEIARHDVQYPVHFYGEIGDEGRWEVGETVFAVAHDIPVPGYHTENTLLIRLWSAAPEQELDLHAFNDGDYTRAFQEKQKAQALTSVLYPSDAHDQGKELRLRQQYFFVCATLQDILARFKRQTGINSKGSVSEEDRKARYATLPALFAIQLNDTHGAIGIAELIRILVDEEGLEWSKAWKICRKIFSYTNHTVLPEALEMWPVSLLQRLLPRHLRIIYDINHFFLERVRKYRSSDETKISRLSIIHEGEVKMVRMANLAIVGSHCLNGVAKIHTGILKSQVFPEYYEIWPNKFRNVTNGVTPRRWVQVANPLLSELLTSVVGTSWLTDMKSLTKLRDLADDERFQKLWMGVKRKNKARLLEYLSKRSSAWRGLQVDALIDVQVKRFHEYKRQLLNILGVIYRYKQIKNLDPQEQGAVVPRIVLFAGKAAPTYYLAKLVIKLIHNAAEVINNDSSIGNLLKIVFLPNYNVSTAEIIIPGSDISQHISTAGMEASGTGNMKFAMNGSLILGTMDGANIEIREAIGQENMFVFGASAGDVRRLRDQMKAQQQPMDSKLAEVLGMIEEGCFGPRGTFESLVSSLRNGNDYYLLSADFSSYLKAQRRVDAAFQMPKRWARMSIMSTAGAGRFASDYSIHDYAERIWALAPCRVPAPSPTSWT